MEKKSNLNRAGAIVSLIGSVLGIFLGLVFYSSFNTIDYIEYKIILTISTIAFVIQLIASIMMVIGKNAKIFTFVSLICTILILSGFTYLLLTVHSIHCFYVVYSLFPFISLIGNILSLIGLKNVA